MVRLPYSKKNCCDITTKWVAFSFDFVGYNKNSLFPDPRVKGWAMMSSPVPTLLICLFYAYFSTVLGPKLMENRKPFNLRKILIFYNCVQTLFSAWICYEVSWTIRQNVLINKVSNYAFLVLNERLVGQLQLQVSTCRLFRQSHGPEGKHKRIF